MENHTESEWIVIVLTQGYARHVSYRTVFPFSQVVTPEIFH